MNNDFYKKLVAESPGAFAYHKILCDEDNIPCDYEFIEVNAAFERLTGLKNIDIVGRKVTEVLPKIRDSKFDWIKNYGDVAINGGSIEFDQFFEGLQQWFRIKVYSPEKYYFITYFSDISNEMLNISKINKLSDMSEQFMQFNGKEIDFQEITDDFLGISGAQYAVFNLYDENGIHYRTKAVSGDKAHIRKVIGILGFDIEGKKWDNNFAREEYIKQKTITRFTSLQDFIGDVIPKYIVNTLQTIFNIGEVVLIKITKNGIMLGDFTIFMSKNKKFESDSVVEIYSRQVGMMITRKRAELAMEENDIKYKELFESAQEAIFVINEKRQIVDANMQACKLTGYSHYELLQKTILDLHPSENIVDDIKEFSNVAFKESHFLYQTLVLNKNGKLIPVEISIGKTFYIGNMQVITGFFRDITDRQKAEDALRESEEKYRLLTENISDVIWVLNLTSLRITYISPSIINLRGYTAEEAISQSLEKALTPESYLIVLDAIEKNKKEYIENPNAKNYHITEVQQPCKNGDIIWVGLSTKFRYNSKGDLEIVGVSRNIEQRKKAEKEMIYLSYNDYLTGLSNRRSYEKELKRIDTAEHLPLALIMVDVNGLKLTNDAFGHEAGDILLKKVSNVLINVCSGNDFVARIGGDEFVFLLPNTDAIDAKEIIDRIIRDTEKVEVDNVIISISIGFSVKMNILEDMNEVYRKAEDKMYRHKLYESTSMRSKTIDLIMNSLYEKNNREMMHSRRVGKLCEAIAIMMDFEKNDVNQLRIAGLMHDIGKIGVIDDILNKKEKLNLEEWEEIKRHSEIGYRILSSVNEFSEIANHVLEHHEKWDGKGYPKGLKGEQISIQARIIALADAYDAMTTDRAYRKALSKNEAINEINKNAGSQFDPDIAKRFVIWLNIID